MSEGYPPDERAVDALGEWCKRVEARLGDVENQFAAYQLRHESPAKSSLEKFNQRLNLLSTDLQLQTKRLTRLSNGTDKPLSVDSEFSKVGTLVRAARSLVKYTWCTGPGYELPDDVRAVELEAIEELKKAIELFAGDYT